MNLKQYNEITKLNPFPTQAEFDALVERMKDSKELSALYAEITNKVVKEHFFNCDECDIHADSNLSRKRIKDKILTKVPQLALFLKNIHPGAVHQVEALTTYRQKAVDFSNISDFKRDLRARHKARWTRAQREVQGNNEVQGGICSWFVI
ncbi:hypothetical protein [Vibrio cyclitrophicus]|uniref:hypothetical protein n=1 Tax=Vibrio cyclitrophicus TaxID=47951 RepID=UPI0038B2E7C5